MYVQWFAKGRGWVPEQRDVPGPRVLYYPPALHAPTPCASLE